MPSQLPRPRRKLVVGVIAATVIANEIRGLFVLITVGPSAISAIWNFAPL